MGENAGFARAVNRGWKAAHPPNGSPSSTVMWSSISRWLERLSCMAGSASFATGTILDADQPRDSRRHLRPPQPRRLRLAGGTRRTGVQAKPGQTHRHRSRHGLPLPPRQFSNSLTASTRASVLISKTSISDCAACAQGFTGIYVPDAIAWHHGSATLGRWNPRVVRLISRNQLLLVARHLRPRPVPLLPLADLAGQLLWGLVALRHGRPLAWLAGKIDGLRGFRLEGRALSPASRFSGSLRTEIRRRANDPYWRWYFRLTRHPRTAAH